MDSTTALLSERTTPSPMRTTDESAGKPRTSLQRSTTPVRTKKNAPTKLTAATMAVAEAAGERANTAAPSPTKGKRRKVAKSASAGPPGGPKAAPAPSSPPPPSPLSSQERRAEAGTPSAPPKQVKQLPFEKGSETPTKTAVGTGGTFAETRRSLPPEDADNASTDDLDNTSTSSVSDNFSDGGIRSGSVRRAPELVTSLAGKRHTKIVMSPPSAPNNGGVLGSLGGPTGSSGTLNGRAVGASGRRGGPSGALGSVSSGGANGHHHYDTTLRYRTDLDKQVIHFMFERYEQEQLCPTVSYLSTNAGEGVQGGGGSEESPGESSHGIPVNSSGNENRNNAGTAKASLPLSSATSSPSPPPQQPPPPPSSSSCSYGLPSGAPPRPRRIAVEEVFVPSNGEGDDRNIGLGDWHFFWMHVGRVRHTICSSDFRWQDHQIINHFPDHAELTRKDLMYRNIKRYLRENQANSYARLTLQTATDWVSAAANAASASVAVATGGGESGAMVSPTAAALAGAATPPPLSSGAALRTKAFCFADSVPITYNIPNDMSMFKEECQKQRGTQWIVKPTSRSQGKGIFIIDDVRALQRWVKEKKETENMASFMATGPANRASWVAPSALQIQRAAQQTQLEAAVAAINAARSPASPRSPNTTTAAAAAVATATATTTNGNGGPSNPPATSSAPVAAGANSSTNTNNNSSSNGTGAGGLGGYIVSRYISNPLLIGGKKFDLRLYVLVTSYKPLVAYLHEDGFARFCATRYNGRSLAQEDLGSHLTNVALQKGDEHYNTSHGGKWSFQNLFLYVQSRCGPYAAEGMMKNIQFLIYHSLKAVEPVMFNDKHSFELYGYDILIDDQINPHLIEVNASPSMSTTTVSDRLLKEQVLTDTLKILFPPGFPMNSKAMPYWEYRLRTDLTTKQQTGFKLLQF
ncbi:putative tubulin tyrosine ligase [Leptomonas pyrrhocoris]|uniref:Putative tubulin tyrosine ligase n=1 Tax=Leptomonas pyrrhocoris TaxID=157538 RepID=A0A0M9FXC5_LEPPY|nr:putative tubulin tyrosine ligase [Leptomonas pyrrhocoris]KPA77816.1 putative tubulin tyrosine ligase [Leptomonas pyrrhocoris]|eukprot:XP_015656255.1 putative tubulin tyrosine ligase [Leptomonas pyrrhocoris]